MNTTWFLAALYILGAILTFVLHDNAGKRLHISVPIAIGWLPLGIVAIVAFILLTTVGRWVDAVSSWSHRARRVHASCT